MRLLLWILAIAGFVIIAVLTATSFVTFATQSSVPRGIAALMVALVVFWPVLGAMLALAVIGTVKGLWKVTKDAFGHDASARLLAAGIVGVIFSDTLRILFTGSFRLFIELFWRIPEFVANTLSGEDIAKMCSDMHTEQFYASCGQGLLAEILKVADQRLTPAMDIFWRLDIGYVLLAAAFWVIGGQLLSGAKDSSGATVRPRWQEALRSLPKSNPTMWANICLFALIGFGGMLAASSIIAVPVISDSSPLSEKDIAEAQKGIDGLFVDADLEKRLAAVPPLKDVLTDLTKVDLSTDAPTTDAALGSVRPGGLASTPSPTKEELSAKRSSAIKEVSEQIDAKAKLMEQLSSTYWVDLADATKRQISGAKTTARNLIAHQNLMLTNTRNKATYLLDVRNWIEVAGNEALHRADECRRQVVNVGNQFREDARSLLRSVAASADAPGAINQLNVTFGYVQTGVSGNATGWREYCFGQGYMRAPEPDAAVPSLGPFSFATWLIKQGSISLTLIAGMFGFGILGAAISTIVRGAVRKAGAPLVADLGVVVIRGASATIVVYLAAKGGLAIVSGTSAPEPNTYVLLLTCFVASVYGEDVWKRARIWLSRGKDGEENQESQDSNKVGDTQKEGEVKTTVTVTPPATGTP